MEETQEIWKPIKGYEGLYEVSNLGRVRSLTRFVRHSEKAMKKAEGQILKPTKLGDYLGVKLYTPAGKQHKKVHKLVAEAFIPNPLNLPQINHKDENKHNNVVDNLEWCTAQYNINYGTAPKRRGLTRGKKVLCVETGKTYYSICEAARELNIIRGNLKLVVHGKRHTAGGYHFKLV